MRIAICDDDPIELQNILRAKIFRLTAGPFQAVPNWPIPLPVSLTFICLMS